MTSTIGVKKRNQNSELLVREGEIERESDGEEAEKIRSTNPIFKFSRWCIQWDMLKISILSDTGHAGQWSTSGQDRSSHRRRAPAGRGPSHPAERVLTDAADSDPIPQEDIDREVPEERVRQGGTDSGYGSCFPYRVLPHVRHRLQRQTSQTTSLDDLRAYIRDLFQQLREDLRELFKETQVGGYIIDLFWDNTWSDVSCSEVTEEARSQTSGSIQGAADCSSRPVDYPTYYATCCRWRYAVKIEGHLQWR
ncbi:hypothetical protein QYF36_002515 [Acer negundo]|nr:hypothetical protein QYF36_002515 [Acer negundo]